MFKEFNGKTKSGLFTLEFMKDELETALTEKLPNELTSGAPIATPTSFEGLCKKTRRSIPSLYGLFCNDLNSSSIIFHLSHSP